MPPTTDPARCWRRHGAARSSGRRASAPVSQASSHRIVDVVAEHAVDAHPQHGAQQCSNCRSQANATRSKRWNSVVSPPVQSEWWRLTASMPRRPASRPGARAPPSSGASRVELTSRTVVVDGRSAASTSRSEWHSHRRGSSSGATLADDVDHGRRRRRLLEVERQVVVRRRTRRAARPASGCARAGRRGASVDDRSARRPSRTTPSWSSTGTPSAVSQTSLSRPVAPSRSAEREGVHRVLPGVGPGAPVGERDRALEQRRQPLLHGAR